MLPTILHHGLTRADYHLLDDGTVRVVDGDRSGRFDAEGYWIEGELRSCDPQMCRWITSEAVMKKHADAQKAARHS